MTTGQYAAISTMAAMQSAQHAISNNIANLGTPGFKQDVPQTGEFNSIFVSLLDVRVGLGQVDTATEIVGSTGSGTELLPMVLDLSQGGLRETSRDLDVALTGPGMFVLELADGSQGYTRNGAFRLDADRTLVDQLGRPVLTTADTPITLPVGTVAVASDGSMTSEAGTALGQLAVVDLPDGATWRKVGDNQFVPDDPTTVVAAVADPQVQQRFLEDSNVEPVAQYAEMLSVLRVFQAASSLLTTLDSLTETTATSVGQV